MATTPIIRQTLQDSTPKREALSARDALFAEAASYGKLEPNFDGDGGRPPAQNDVNNMLSFIDHIPDPAIGSVRLMLAGDGEIGFEWKRHGKYCLQVVFVENGEMVFYGKIGDKEISGTVDYDENAIPDKLLKFLSDLSGQGNIPERPQ